MALLKSDKDYLCVSFSETNIKIAHLKVSPAVKEVVAVAKRDIRGIAEEEWPQLVKSVVADFNVKNPEVICAISPNVTTTKNIEIPSLDPQEIKSIINLQAGRHTPYSREEIILDYINIGVYQRNYSKIFLVIVNRNVIKKQLGILEQAHLMVQKIIFAPESAARFYSTVLNLSGTEIPTGVLNINSAFADFIIEFKGTVITCRSIPVGMEHILKEGPIAYERLVAELKKSIESYQGEDIEKIPDNYILTIDTSHIKDLQPILKKELNANVKIVPYLDSLKVNQATRKVIMDSHDESFLDVIAPVITVAENKIDLLPEEVKMQHTIEEHGREVIKAGIFAIIILMFFCAVFFSKAYFKNAMLENLRSNYEEKRKNAESLEKISEKTRLVKDYLNSRMVSLDVLNELYRLIPDEIYLNAINLDEKGTLTIQGVSESMSRVFSLVSALEESDMFKGVKTTSTTAKKERGKDVAAFELTFKLESAKEEEEGEVSEPVAVEKDAQTKEAAGKEQGKEK